MRKMTSATSSRRNFGIDGLAALLEVEIPEIAIDQRDHDAGAEQGERGADVVPLAQIDPVNPDGGVESEGEREELEEDAEAHAGAAFQQPPDGERDEKGRDENRDRGESVLRSQQERAFVRPGE